MAKNRAVGRLEAVLALVGVIALVVTYSLLTGWNPLPDAQDWANQRFTESRTLSNPAPTWKIETGDEPSDAVIGTGAAVISSRGVVEAHSVYNGDKLWSRSVAWSGVAGSGDGIVIAGLVGKQHGYDAVDPATGSVKWHVNKAIGVWTYTNLVIDITCDGLISCTLTARSPQGGSVRWTTELPGNGRGLAGANEELSGTRRLGDLIAPPAPAPPLLGFPMGDQIQVLSSASGRRLHAYQTTQTTRVVVAGNRVVVSTQRYHGGNCRFSVDGRNPDGDRQVWHLDGYDLRTSSGLGCDQRKDPIGEGGLLDAIGPDDRELLLNESTGSIVYKAAPDEAILATDGRLALVRGADGRTVRAVNLGGGSTAWTRQAAKSVDVGFGPGVVLFTDPDAGRLVALSGQGGTLLDAKTGATVLGYADNGLVIHVGRQVGLLGYGASARE